MVLIIAIVFFAGGLITAVFTSNLTISAEEKERARKFRIKTKLNPNELQSAMAAQMNVLIFVWSRRAMLFGFLLGVGNYFYN
jgi:hypothetical protein